MNYLTLPTNLIFGPVPSRRLGHSLGINHIPPKTCTYACIYCQLGRTSRMCVARQSFYAPEAIVAAIREKVAAVSARGETVDYLTFVPDGEPTLDSHLGEVLATLKPLTIPLAVISNTSLITEPATRAALAQADWVSLKVDAGDEATWHHTNRPHSRLHLDKLLAGARAFAREFQGQLVTETMLVSGVNDAPEALTATAKAITALHPDVAYLSVPTRPPAEAWVKPPDTITLNQAYQIFADALPHVELLIGYEGNAFAATGNVVNDLLSITAVHPMREDAVHALVARAGAEWDVVQTLVAHKQLLTSVYHGRTFYLRNLRGGSL